MRPLILSTARAVSSSVETRARSLLIVWSTDTPVLRCRSYAEMDGAAKNKISHRYRALEKLRKYLLEQKE